MKENKYRITQYAGDDMAVYDLYHEMKFTQEEFIEKYNFVVEKLRSNRNKSEKIYIDEVAEMMSELFQFEKIFPEQRIHCLKHTMERINKEDKDIALFVGCTVIGIKF